MVLSIVLAVLLPRRSTALIVHLSDEQKELPRPVTAGRAESPLCSHMNEEKEGIKT